MLCFSLVYTDDVNPELLYHNIMIKTYAYL